MAAFRLLSQTPVPRPYFGTNAQQRPFQTVFSKGTHRHGFARKAGCRQVALQQARVGGDVGSGLGSVTGISIGDGCSGNSGGGRSAGRGGSGSSGFGAGGVSGSGGHPGGVGTAPASEGVNPRVKSGGIEIDRTISRHRRRPKSFALCALEDTLLPEASAIVLVPAIERPWLCRNGPKSPAGKNCASDARRESDAAIRLSRPN